MLYFRDRYFRHGDYTHNFHDLRFTSQQQRQRAAAFVDNSAADEVESLSGLLVIVYRLRNNLFHGAKWADGIRGQIDNFTHASITLTRIMELHRG